MVLPAVLVLAAAAGCGPTIASSMDDASITARVKTALLNDPIVGGLGIDVATLGGVVTLSGQVAQDADAAHAATVARQIDGVVDVESRLRIVPPLP